MVKYNIISTGSDGNATILEDFVLVDCGVPYKALEPYRTPYPGKYKWTPSYTPFMIFVSLHSMS